MSGAGGEEFGRFCGGHIDGVDSGSGVRASSVAWTRAEGDRMRAAGLEVGWVAEEVPAIRKFPGSAEIIAGVEGLPRLAALQRQNRVDLPAFQQLRKRLLAGEGVRDRKRETVPDIKIAGPIFTVRIQAVFRQILVPVIGLVI